MKTLPISSDYLFGRESTHTMCAHTVRIQWIHDAMYKLFTHLFSSGRCCQTDGKVSKKLYLNVTINYSLKHMICTDICSI